MTDPRKRVSISIGSNGSDYDYAMATMAVISFYIGRLGINVFRFHSLIFQEFSFLNLSGIFILTVTFSILEFRYKYSDFEQVKENIVEKLKKIELPNIELPDFGQVKYMNFPFPDLIFSGAVKLVDMKEKFLFTIICGKNTNGQK